MVVGGVAVEFFDDAGSGGNCWPVGGVQALRGARLAGVGAHAPRCLPHCPPGWTAGRCGPPDGAVACESNNASCCCWSGLVPVAGFAGGGRLGGRVGGWNRARLVQGPQLPHNGAAGRRSTKPPWHTDPTAPAHPLERTANHLPAGCRRVVLRRPSTRTPLLGLVLGERALRARIRVPRTLLPMLHLGSHSLTHQPTHETPPPFSRVFFPPVNTINYYEHVHFSEQEIANKHERHRRSSGEDPMQLKFRAFNKSVFAVEP